MVIRFLASNPIFARFRVPDNYLDYASHPSPHFIFSTHNIRLSSLSINIRATVFSLVCSLRPGLSLPLQINIFILQFKFHPGPGPSRGQQNFAVIFTRFLQASVSISCGETMFKHLFNSKYFVKVLVDAFSEYCENAKYR